MIDDSDLPPLDEEVVKKTVLEVLAEELQLDVDTVRTMSDSFQFDESKSLDEYGLDSVTAMKIASRLTNAFKLKVPLSPFMFFQDPSLEGNSNIKQTTAAAGQAILISC